MDSQLEVPEGERLSIVGGDIRIEGDGDPSSGAPTLSAPGGRVSLVSVASSGEVGFDPTCPQLDVEVESVDEQDVDTFAGEEIGGRRTGQTAADDQDIGFHSEFTRRRAPISSSHGFCGRDAGRRRASHPSRAWL